MRRREFITLLGGAAAAWPLAARGQPTDRIARVGFFGAGRGTPLTSATYQAFLDEMQIHGFKDGQNLVVDFRRLEQDLPALSADAAELVRSNVRVLVTQGTEPALRAALAASRELPIVMMFLPRTHRRLRPPAFPTRSRPRLVGTAMEISRFPGRRLLRMPGSATTRGWLVSCDNDTGHLAFCWTENISAPNLSYAAQYLAYALPYQRFACGLTTTRA
jgi:hypothetical protein